MGISTEVFGAQEIGPRVYQILVPGDYRGGNAREKIETTALLEANRLGLEGHKIKRISWGRRCVFPISPKFDWEVLLDCEV